MSNGTEVRTPVYADEDGKLVLYDARGYECIFYVTSPVTRTQRLFEKSKCWWGCGRPAEKIEYGSSGKTLFLCKECPYPQYSHPMDCPAAPIVHRPSAPKPVGISSDIPEELPFDLFGAN